MIDVLIAFGIIGTVILIGYIVGRAGILGEQGGVVLSRAVVLVLSPCLLFTVLAETDLHAFFSSMLLVTLAASLAVFVTFALVARLVWKRAVPEVVIGTLGSGYVNAVNIGIPVAAYVLGDAALVAPVILLQLLVFIPVALTALDAKERGKSASWRILLQPFTNPIIIGSMLGVLLSVTGIRLPDPVMEPFRVVGAAAVPLVLIAFGMSLHGQHVLRPGSGRRDILLASALKLVVMPAVAWLLGQFVFGLDGVELFAVVVFAALPAAQNVFTYAQRYNRGEIIARDTILITSIGSIPVIALIAVLLN